MQLSVFVDLDETLVRTVHLSRASELFNFGVIGDVQQKIKEKRAFYNLVELYYQGKTQSLEALAEKFGIIFVLINDDTYVSQLRPFVKEFLEELHQIFDNVYLLTAGNRDFQIQILKSFHIYNFFDAVFAMEDINRVYHTEQPLIQNELSLLIDDLSLGTSGIISKLKAMGLLPIKNLSFEEIEEFIKDIGNLHHLQIEAYYGDKDDLALLNILPIITEKINDLLNFYQ